MVECDLTVNMRNDLVLTFGPFELSNRCEEWGRSKGGRHLQLQQQFKRTLTFHAYMLIMLTDVFIPFSLAAFAVLCSWRCDRQKDKLLEAEDTAQGRQEQKCSSYSFRVRGVNNQHTADETCAVSHLIPHLFGPKRINWAVTETNLNVVWLQVKSDHTLLTLLFRIHSWFEQVALIQLYFNIYVFFLHSGRPRVAMTSRGANHVTWIDDVDLSVWEGVTMWRRSDMYGGGEVVDGRECK